jgi:hypothetical protein
MEKRSRALCKTTTVSHIAPECLPKSDARKEGERRRKKENMTLRHSLLGIQAFFATRDLFLILFSAFSAVDCEGFWGERCNLWDFERV